MHLKSFLRWLPVAVLPAVTLWAAIAAPVNLPQALDAQLELARQHPDDAAVFNDLGNLLSLAGNLEDAEDAYLHALSVDPSLASARYNLGLLLDQQGKYRRAAKQFQELVEAHPDHAWGYYQLGIQLARQGRIDKAVKAYSRAFTLDPELTFAEVNPHVIDNPYYTRALIGIDREKATGSTAPRVYEERVRITKILVEPSLTGEQPIGATEDTEDTMAETFDTGDSQVIQNGPTAMENARNGRVNQAQPVPRVSTTARPTSPGAAGTGEKRTLTSSDLDPSSEVNQASRGARPAQPRPRRLPGSVRRGLEGTGTVQPGVAPNQPNAGNPAAPNPRGRVRYRPGTNSTGRLDIELVPAGPGSLPADAAAG